MSSRTARPRTTKRATVRDRRRVTSAGATMRRGSPIARQPARLVYVTWEKPGSDTSKPAVWDHEELLLDVFPSFERVRAICKATREARGFRDARMRAVVLDRHLEKARARVVPADDLHKLIDLAAAVGATLIHAGDDSGKDLRDLVVKLRPFSDLPPAIE